MLNDIPTPHTRTRRRKTALPRGCTFRGTSLLTFTALVLIICQTVQGQTSGAVARWGQASSLVSSLFLVHGGRTEGVWGGGTSYTLGTNSADLLLLDVNTAFTVGLGSVAPWQVVSTADTSTVATADGVVTTPPSVSFGSLSPMTHRQILLFGGENTAAPLQSGNDSAYSFQLNGLEDGTYSATWQLAPTAWAQPERRMYHSTESDGRGGLWIIGGQRADGSMLALPDAWSFNHSASAPVFAPLAAPTGSIQGATATLLSDERILLLGGTGSSGALQGFDSVVVFDTGSSTWSTLRTRGVNGSSSAVPAPRRGHVAVSLPDQRVFIHGGSSAADFSTVLSDAWILDWSVNPPRWTQVASSTAAPSARAAHSAIAYGRKVILTLGWAGTAPADQAVYVFDATSMTNGGDGEWTGGAWASSYTPDPQVTSSSSASGAGEESGTGSDNNAGGNGLSTSSGGSLSDVAVGSSGSIQSSGSSEAASSTRTGNSRTSRPTSTLAPSGATTGANASSTSAASDNSDVQDDAGVDNDGQGSSTGAKAGAAIGSLVAVGLVAVAAYALYNRHQRKKRVAGWQYGRPGGEEGYSGGRAGLIHGTGNVGYGQGGDDGDEKDSYLASPPAHTEAGAAWSPPISLFPVTFHTTSRPSKRPNDLAAADTYGNIGRSGVPVNVSGGAWAGSHSHATEGSGPGVREKLAMLTGLNGWSQSAHQDRFDMLADEDRETPYSSPDKDDLDYTYGGGDGLEGNFEAGEVGHAQAHNDYDPYDYDAGYLAYEPEVQQGAYHSPQRIRSYGTISGAAAGIVAAVRTASGQYLENTHQHQRLATEDEYDYYLPDRLQEKSDRYTSKNHQPAASNMSQQGSSRSTRTHAGESSRHSMYDNLITATGHGSRSSSLTHHSHQYGPDSSGSMKRSSSWWDRIMSGASVMDRTASGRLAILPSAREPIRDPALPPVISGLSAIKESPRSVDPSEDRGTFVDTGRKRKAVPRSTRDRALESLKGVHGRSQSSLQSGASSQLEARLAGMDVVQRTRTESTDSNATISTKRSRGNHISSMSAVVSGYSGGSGGLPMPVEELDEGKGEEHISFQASEYEIGDVSQASVEGTPGGLADLSLSAMSESDGLGPDESMDIVGDRIAGGTAGIHGSSPFDDIYEAEGGSTMYHRQARLPRLPSEVPSITPLTTKRARQNPSLTAPTRPSPRKEQQAPIIGSVKDRVEAIEKRKAELLLAAASAATAAAANPPQDATATTSAEAQRLRAEACASPAIGTPKVSHGLVSKAQLFVANPDHSRRGRGLPM